MFLNIIAEDSRLQSGTQCCLIASVEYNGVIPWKTIHEAERFLRLKIIVCENCGSEHFINEFQTEKSASEVPYEEIMSSFQTIDCSSKADFLDVLNNGIVEYFGDCLPPDLVDAVLVRNN